MEYDALATSLKRELEADATVFDAERLESVTADDLRRWLAPHDLPLVVRPVSVMLWLRCCTAHVVVQV
jgi:hypothetical protein